MTRGVRWYLAGSFILVALIALAGCSHYMLAEREPWRHDAEIACLNSGAVKESPTRVRISAISGPGAKESVNHDWDRYQVIRGEEPVSPVPDT